MVPKPSHPFLQGASSQIHPSNALRRMPCGANRFDFKGEACMHHHHHHHRHRNPRMDHPCCRPLPIGNVPGVVASIPARKGLGRRREEGRGEGDVVVRCSDRRARMVGPCSLRARRSARGKMGVRMRMIDDDDEIATIRSTETQAGNGFGSGRNEAGGGAAGWKRYVRVGEELAIEDEWNTLYRKDGTEWNGRVARSAVVRSLVFLLRLNGWDCCSW